MGGDGFTPVHVTTDPVESELLADVLREEAIDARVVRVNAALLGAGQQIFQTRIEVPVAQEARARELIAELGRPGDLEEFSEAPEPMPDDGSAERRRQQRLGAGVAFILPGAGHFRARRPWTTVVLIAGVLTCMILLGVLWSPFACDLLFVTLFALLVCDALGSRRVDRNVTASLPRQLGRGFGLVVIATITGFTVAAGAALPGWLRERAAGGIGVACSAEDLIVWNQSGTERQISIDRVRVAAGGLAFRAGIRGGESLRLQSGTQARLDVEVPAFVESRCRAGAGQKSEDCVLIARVISVDPAKPDGASVETRAWCEPNWSAATRAPAKLIDPEDFDERLETLHDY